MRPSSPPPQQRHEIVIEGQRDDALDPAERITDPDDGPSLRDTLEDFEIWDTTP
jgi:hypothetical protein